MASGAAREANRTARVTSSAQKANDVGARIVRQIGKGVLDEAQVASVVGDTQARTTVSGKAAQILPFIRFPRVSETVEGPVERYVEDDGATP